MTPLSTLATVLALLVVQTSGNAAVIVTDPGSVVRIRPEFPATFFDLDNDGVDEIWLRINGIHTYSDSTAENQILGIRDFIGFSGAAIPGGGFIGAPPPLGTTWTDTEVFLNACSTGDPPCSGNYIGGIAYLGVEFDIAGATHYGWLEIESSSIGTRAWIHRWAYETEPGVGLIAGIPEPGSAGLLFLGGVLLASKRRRKRSP